MTSFAVTPSTAPTIAVAFAPSPKIDITTGTLPKPVVAAADPHSALTLLLMSSELLSAIEHKARALATNGDHLLDSHVESLRAATDPTNEHDGPDFLGPLMRCATDVVGAVVDVFCDYVALPINVVKAAASGENVRAALLSDFADLGKAAEARKAIEGFTSGVTKFAADVAAFGAEVSVTVGKAGVGAGGILDELKNGLRRLATSLDNNLLSNPEFWSVMGTIAKAVGLAGTLATGGPLGVICLGLLAVSAADMETGFIARFAGETATPWLRAALQLGAALCGALVGNSGAPVVRTIQAASATAEGVRLIGPGVTPIFSPSEQQFHNQATPSLLNPIQRLHRICADLFETLSNTDEEHTSAQGQISQADQAHGTAEMALAMRV